MFIHMHCSLLIIHIVLFFFFVFFFPCLSVIYIMYSLFPTDTSLKWEEERGRKKKGKDQLASLTLTTNEWKREKLHYMGEWQENVKHNAMTGEEQKWGNFFIFYFFCPPLFHVCVAEKQRSHLCGPCTHTPQHTHTHTYTHPSSHSPRWPCSLPRGTPLRQSTLTSIRARCSREGRASVPLSRTYMHEYM